MGQISPITISDGAATPVAHTFTPIQSVPIAMYRDSLAAAPTIGQPIVTASVVHGKGDIDRVKVSVRVPSMENIGGNQAWNVASDGYVAAPKVAYVTAVTAEFMLPKRSSAQDKKNVRVFMLNLLGNVQIIDAIENLVTPY